MDRVKEIEKSIEQLTPGERARLERWFYTNVLPLDQIRESQEAENRIEELAVKYEAGSDRRRISVDEYLAFELNSLQRHEYVAGQTFAMSGASRAHNLISANMATAIKSHLRGGPCDVYMSDFKLKLKVASEDVVYYPDIMVDCERRKRDRYHTSRPKLIVEVLSPSTRDTDQREKYLSYRHLASVEEYVMVEQDRPELTIYRRGVMWQRDFICGLDAIAEFKSISLAMPLAQIFEGVTAY